MNHAPEPRQPEEAEEASLPMDVLEDALECSVLTPDEHTDFRLRMGNALLYQALETVQILDGTFEEPAPSPVQRMSRAQRRAALRRRRILVNVLLVVALSTLLVSLYALGLRHEVLGWFGLAGALGLSWMAHRAEEGK